MLVIISPAKTLDYDSPLATERFTQPEMLDKSKQLIKICRELTPAQIASLMSISDKLAGLNAARFSEWQPKFTPDNARQALLAFKGDVYTGLQAQDFSEADFDFAQQHLRMLSGLYGVLRPLDLMMPYRLEMGLLCLEKLVDFNKKFIRYWGYGDHKYDTLLDQYEPGVTVELVDKVFGELRDAIVPLVKRIKEEGEEPETSFLYEYFPKDAQIDFSVELLKQMGYDFDSGRLDETVHPFAIGLNPGDVRITTRYDENDFRMAVFGTIHEGGHALYEQNISEELFGTPLCTGTSMGIHESQSLFYENIVARDRNYWVHNFPLLQKYAPEQFGNVTLDQFYRAINEAKPSLIRIEADDLTYALHIIIRYEIEKALFSDEIEVADLPEIWNDKYEQYLGIRPENDAEGILQDVHWSDGSFGYFPSYALGYMYAAQLKNAMQKYIPNYEELLRKGDLEPIKGWLNEKVHVHGKLKKPLEIIEAATGEGLNARPLIEYLESKFSAVYKLGRP